jgi:hypothetical protein
MIASDFNVTPLQLVSKIAAAFDMIEVRPSGRQA